MVYGNFGAKVEIVREGTIEDVRTLDHRKADKQDREALKNGSYVVIRFLDGVQGKYSEERLYHIGHLRADNGFSEVVDAMRAAGIANRVTDPDC